MAPASGAVTTFPSGGGLLPANATGFDDPSPGGVGCYFAGVLGGNPSGSLSYGISDVICLYRGLASGATPPNFKAQVDGDLVTLTWAAPGGQSGYVLFVIHTDGSLGFEALGSGATSIVHDTDGATMCYQLRTAGVAGQTDVLCPVPNAGTAGVASNVYLR